MRNNDANTIIFVFVGNIVAKLNIMQLVKSVFASAIGVQSEENRRKAFEQGSPMAFVIAGATFTALFVGLLILIVSLVL